MKLNNLPQKRKDELLAHFRAAVLARVNQWDHELAIETILGQEVDIEIGDWATCDNPAMLTWKDFVEAVL